MLANLSLFDRFVPRMLLLLSTGSNRRRVIRNALRLVFLFEVEECVVKQSLFREFQRLTFQAQTTVESCRDESLDEKASLEESSHPNSVTSLENVHVQLIQAYGEYKKHISEHGC